jgi:hypothetical protein
MEAIIGRYRVTMEEDGLVLKHPSKISFDLTIDEALGLVDFINVYREAMLELEHESERETDPELKRIVVVERENHSND